MFYLGIRGTRSGGAFAASIHKAVRSIGQSAVSPSLLPTLGALGRSPLALVPEGAPRRSAKWMLVAPVGASWSTIRHVSRDSPWRAIRIYTTSVRLFLQSPHLALARCKSSKRELQTM